MKKSSVKRLLIVLAVCAAVMAVLVALNSIDFDSIDIAGWFGNKDEDETISFYIPDYDTNIYENEAYMAKTRYITYIEDPYSTVITENINEYGDLGLFFLDYFKALTDGDAELYNGFFTDAYFEDNDLYKRFTMQKIYDIYVEELTDDIIKDDPDYYDYERYTFKVGYKIMCNDGTFRKDMPSDTTVPLIFEVLYDGTDYKINSINKIKYVN